MNIYRALEDKKGVRKEGKKKNVNKKASGKRGLRIGVEIVKIFAKVPYLRHYYSRRCLN